MKILLSLLTVFCLAAPAAAQVPQITFEKQRETSPKELPEAAEGQPYGVVIDASNAPEYRSLIVPEFYGYVRSHQIFMDSAARLKADLALLKTAPAKTLSKVSDLLQANGSLKVGTRLESGLIFPEWKEEKDEARRARMLLWNVQAVRWSAKLHSANFKLLWLEDGKPVKKVGGFWQLVFPVLLNSEDKSIQLFREKIALNAPQFLKGFNWLTFRFLGNDEDMLWHSSSVLNKTIQLTGSNRTDSILNSALSADDFMLWNGKAELVAPQIESETEKLAAFSSLDFKLLKQAGAGCYGIEASAQKTELKFNFESRRFPDGFDWLPSSAVYVPRKMLKLEMVPLDPFSLYGRQVLYVDSELMIPYYKFVYNRAGYLWKSEMAVYDLAKTADSSRAAAFLDFMVIDDRQKKQTNILEFSDQSICDQYPANLKISDFDPQQLIVK